jgi:hypothetical protein
LADIQSFTAGGWPRCTYTSLTVDDYASIAGLPAGHFGTETLPSSPGAVLALAMLLHYLTRR